MNTVSLLMEIITLFAMICLAISPLAVKQWLTMRASISLDKAPQRSPSETPLNSRTRSNSNDSSLL
ncbi:hypothetical protein [Marinomonas mediterranea]|uniref:hypothetical protein n=1 Tax=Marinomonas mediterranea TaxID=119864 RepID=UPI002349A911|nr:hypothetical protein [Marinomonas mediterranea]WCN07710.1 hypothetical protein GV055_01610 [Marinomonas mediterranea]